MVASLVMPALVAIIGRHLDELLILIFWPGSIALMSPGAGQRPFADVVYAWSVAIALNLALYFLVSLIFLIITKYFKKTWNSKQQLKIITNACSRTQLRCAADASVRGQVEC
jgi:hypothetical protein